MGERNKENVIPALGEKNGVSMHAKRMVYLCMQKEKQLENAVQSLRSLPYEIPSSI